MKDGDESSDILSKFKIALQLKNFSHLHHISFDNDCFFLVCEKVRGLGIIINHHHQPLSPVSAIIIIIHYYFYIVFLSQYNSYIEQRDKSSYYIDTATSAAFFIHCTHKIWKRVRKDKEGGRRREQVNCCVVTEQKGTEVSARLFVFLHNFHKFLLLLLRLGNPFPLFRFSFFLLIFLSFWTHILRKIISI